MTVFEKIYDALFKTYGPQGWWPLIDRTKEPLKCNYHPENTYKKKNSEEVFEICIGAILTQNTAWSNAEKALVSLLSADYLEPAALSRVPLNVISGIITSSGYYNQKAKKIKTFSVFYRDNPSPGRKALLSLWGLGPETADDMLLYAYDKPFFVVDIYTKRLFSRLGLCSEKVSYDELQALISDGIEKDFILYKEYHALIVRHAKEHCRKTPDCNNCALSSYCAKGSGISVPERRG